MILRNIPLLEWQLKENIRDRMYCWAFSCLFLIPLITVHILELHKSFRKDAEASSYREISYATQSRQRGVLSPWFIESLIPQISLERFKIISCFLCYTGIPLI